MPSHDDHDHAAHGRGVEGRLLHAVATHGWWVGIVDGTAAEPAFAYTVGLQRTFNHPELVIVGLPPKTMHTVLNDCGDRIRAGEPCVPGARMASILTGYDVKFRAVTARESFRAHVGYALWYYRGVPFGLVQCLWPDKEHRFPGDPDAAAWLTDRQPLLA